MMKKSVEKVLYTLSADIGRSPGRFWWTAHSTAHDLLLPRHPARQFSTRHNFFDITPNQVIQKPKLIYSTSSTTSMKNSKPNSGHNPAQNTKQIANHDFRLSKVYNSFNSKPNEAIQVPKFIYSTRPTIIF